MEHNPKVNVTHAKPGGGACRYCLEKRSEMSEPYTLLGSVLVAVNPLMVIQDPPGIRGSKKAISCAHPYGIAEVAYGSSYLHHFFGGKKLACSLTLFLLL